MPLSWMHARVRSSEYEGAVVPHAAGKTPAGSRTRSASRRTAAQSRLAGRASARLLLAAVPPRQQLIDSYARLLVRIGANVQPGQLVQVAAQTEHAALVRAIAREAYAAGARYVDVFYAEPYARRALIEVGPDDSLEWSPPWLVERARALGEQEGAMISLSGNPHPELFAGLDEARVGRARPRELTIELLKLTTGLANWVIAAGPNEGWAQTVFGEPDIDRLWDAVAACTRLDEPDPVQAWQDHLGALESRGGALNRRRLPPPPLSGPRARPPVR